MTPGGEGGHIMYTADIYIHIHTEGHTHDAVQGEIWVDHMLTYTRITILPGKLVKENQN